MEKDRQYWEHVHELYLKGELINLQDISSYTGIKAGKARIIMMNYGLHLLSRGDAMKRACLKKYSVSNVFATQDVKDKIAKTNTERYGAPHTWNSNSKCRETYRQTMIERYGVDNAWKSSKLRDNNMAKTRETTKQHSYETRKRNNTFNTSKPEKRCFEKLLLVFQDTISQYTDERYPYKCDLYVPSRDLFIELNFGWTHGGRPYEDNDECNKIAILWQNKNTRYYKNALYNWTVRDVEKRKCAKHKNLNYMEFFYEEDFDNWLNSITVNKGGN